MTPRDLVATTRWGRRLVGTHLSLAILAGILAWVLPGDREILMVASLLGVLLGIAEASAVGSKGWVAQWTNGLAHLGSIAVLFVICLETYAIWRRPSAVIVVGFVGLSAAYGLLMTFTLPRHHDPTLPSTPRLRAIFTRTCLVFLSLCITLMTLEAVARKTWPESLYEVRPEPDSQARRLYVPHRWLQRTMAPEFRGRTVHPNFPNLLVETNEHGFRDRPWPSPNEPNTSSRKRIVGLGDSYVFGVGVDQEDGFLRQLEQHPDSASPHTFNLGVPGFAPTQEFLLLDQYLEELRPDLVVVVVFAGNDLKGELSYRRFLDRRFKREASAMIRAFGLGKMLPRQWIDRMRERSDSRAQIREDSAFLPIDRGSVDSPFARLGNRAYWSTSSRLFKYVQPRVIELLVRARIVHPRTLGNDFLLRSLRRDPDPDVDRAEQLLFSALVSMKTRCQGVGSEFLVLLAPHAIQVDVEMFEQYFSDRTGLHLYEIDAVQRRLGKLCRSRQIEILDLLPELRAHHGRDPACFHPEGHWSAVGHRLVAKLTAERLQALGWVY